MSEPLREGRPNPDMPGETDRAARIEELLLAGLDQYFAGRYEEAIDVWTRVAFFERGHHRARAYIDRARGALAERQRESEENLHDGVAAYRAGDQAAARELLTRAVEQGGASDTALVFLQRLARLEAASGVAAPGRHLPRESDELREAPGRSTSSWAATVGASLIVVVAVVLVALPIDSWLRERPVGPVASGVTVEEPLPVVRASERLLEDARRLAVERPGEALRLLGAIDGADPMRAEADLLRADIQRALLARLDEGRASP